MKYCKLSKKARVGLGTQVQAWSRGYCRDEIGVVFPVRATVLFRPADGEAVIGAIVRGALPSGAAWPTSLPNSQAPAPASAE